MRHPPARFKEALPNPGLDYSILSPGLSEIFQIMGLSWKGKLYPIQSLMMFHFIVSL